MNPRFLFNKVLIGSISLIATIVSISPFSIPHNSIRKLKSVRDVSSPTRPGPLRGTNCSFTLQNLSKRYVKTHVSIRKVFFMQS